MAHHTAFTTSSNRKLELNFTGAAIGASTYLCNFVMPRIKTVKASPQVGGPEVITYDVEFKAVYDGTNAPLQVVYQSTDTAL